MTINYFRYSMFFSFVFLLFTTFVFAQQRPIRTFDVQHYIIRTSFDESKRQMFGDTTIQLKPLADDFREFELDAANMKFESVKLDSSNELLSAKLIGEKLKITLNKSYSKDELISVRLKYSIQNPLKGMYFVDELRDKDIIIRDKQIWSQGEANENHHWFPNYDYPDDKATSEQFITTSEDQTAISNGELIEVLNNPNKTKTFHFKMNAVHSSYLISLVIGKYVKVVDKFGSIPVTYWVYPGEENLSETAFKNTPQMIGIFQNLTKIDFPYNKYDQTIVAEFKFGGMENITATTMADTEIKASKLKSLAPEVEDLVSHELAHSWFGDLVTCKNWSELWLNEGFATYMEAAYREKHLGTENYKEKLRSELDRFFVDDLFNKNKHPLYNLKADPNDDGLFDVITYQKGGLVLSMLRETIGTDNFWKAVNNYLSKHKFDNVETTDLQKAMEEASGQNLQWFFNQWVYSAGYPMLKISSTFNPKKKLLNVNVAQTQKTLRGDATIPTAFRLPLELTISTSGKKITEQILVEKRLQKFTFSVESKPTLELDKEQKIILKKVVLRQPIIVR